jgi:hypothetical protein
MSKSTVLKIIRVHAGGGRRRMLFASLSIASFILYTAFSQSAAAAKRRTPDAPDSNYAPALAAADHFLQFWQSGDIEDGMALLSTHAKAGITVDGLDQFFSNPVSAYEISRGTRLKNGSYEFPIAVINAPANRRRHRHFSSIVVVNTGNGDWAVDKLP